MIYFFFSFQGSLLRTYSDINLAMTKFVHQYESHHGVTISDWELEQATTSEAGTYFCSGIFRLDLNYRKANNEKFLSSVILKMPQLGVLENHPRCMLIYKRETYVYETLLPLMYRSWSQEKLTLHFYACTESRVLVLENYRSPDFT